MKLKLRANIVTACRPQIHSDPFFLHHRHSPGSHRLPFLNISLYMTLSHCPSLWVLQPARRTLSPKASEIPKQNSCLMNKTILPCYILRGPNKNDDIWHVHMMMSYINWVTSPVQTRHFYWSDLRRPLCFARLCFGSVCRRLNTAAIHRQVQHRNGRNYFRN